MNSAAIKYTPLTTRTRSKDPQKIRMQEALKNPLTIIRELNNRSLFSFLEYFWPEVSADEFKPNWHIKYLCSELEKLVYQVAEHKPREHDLIINVPPGTTKTITVSILFPAWCWTKWYWMRFITASYSSALSLESAEYSRDLIKSDSFKAVYPELDIKQDKDTKGNFRVIKKEWVYAGQAPRIHHGGNRYSTSVGGTLTGFHGHILLVDDPLNPNQAHSEVELNNANRWVEQTLSTRKTDKAVTPTVVVMQRLHQNDPSGHWLDKKKKNVKHISLPGEIRNYGEQLQPPELRVHYKDDLLDPVRLSWAVLEDLEADLGQYGFAGQIGQKPTPPGGGMFQMDSVPIIDMLPAPVNFVRTIRYWDKAGSDGKGAFTVGCKMSILKNGRFIIHDIKRGQWASHKREQVIRSTAEADGATVAVYIEQEPGSGGKESAEGTISNLRGYACYADRPTGDKIYRADPFSVQMNNGNVSLLRGDWIVKMKEEFENFPFSTFKDQVDAGSGAFNKLTGKKIARGINSRR